ncbi:hypothetical protein [Nocardia sp. NPDC057668]|uniref:hypothetical protein n=1 Tax=Nocardia sp. NPDC057668 TaxID=3346202 RepID=UPI00367099EA
MGPTHEWHAIVADDWPMIAPARWRELADAARAGAVQLDSAAAVRASRELDQLIGSSQGLGNVTDVLRQHSLLPEAFARTLLAAADTLDALAGHVERTRHKILDIVDGYRAAAAREPAGEHPSDEHVAALTEHARADVQDLVKAAIEQIGPTNLFDLTQLVRDPIRSVQLDAADTPTGPTQLSEAEIALLQHERSTGPPPLPASTSDSQVQVGPTVRPWGASDVNTLYATSLHASADSIVTGGQDAHAEPPTRPEHIAADAAAFAPSRQVRDENQVLSVPERTSEVTPRDSATVTPMLASLAAITGRPLIHLDGAAQPVTLQRSELKTPAIRSTEAAKTTEKQRISQNKAGSSASESSRSRAGLVSARPPQSPARSHESDRAGDAVLNSAFAAALAAAAAPAHNLGPAVDTDLVLARTLVASIAAAMPSTPGLACAIAVLQHGRRVSVFLTTNEGQGWIPGGFYLPEHLGSPWNWNEADPGWTSFADPAQILADFASRWSPRHGATMSAIASTHPIDLDLRTDVTAASFAESVRPEPILDLTRSAPGLLDRFAFAGNREPHVLPRFDRAQLHRDRLGLVARCLTAAAMPSSHTRTGLDELSQLRTTIVAALRGARPVPDRWWESLYAGYGLLGADLITQRLHARRNRDARYTPDRHIQELLLNRRRTELVLLLRNEPTLRNRRELQYAYAHCRTESTTPRGGVK